MSFGSWQRKRLIWKRLQGSSGPAAADAAWKLGGCGLAVAGVLLSGDSGALRCDKIVRVTCKHRVCPVCAEARAGRMRVRLMAAALAAVTAGRRLGMLTLTVAHKAGESLRQVRDRISSAWRSLTRLAGWRRFAWASFRSIEVERNGASGWHVHIHVLVVCNSRKRVEAAGERLGALWSSAVGRSAFCRWRGIQVCKDAPDMAVVRTVRRGRWAVRRVPLVKVLSEVTKYVTTAGCVVGLADAELEDYLKGMRGLRVYQSSMLRERVGGRWVRRGWVSTEGLDDVDAEGREYVDWKEVCHVIRAHDHQELRRAVSEALLLEAAETGRDCGRELEALRFVDDS